MDSKQNNSSEADKAPTASSSKTQRATFGSCSGREIWMADGCSVSLNDPVMLGTIEEGKRLEAIKLSIPGIEDGGIEYRVHAQTYGWMEWQSDGAVAGTEGEAKRLEALQISLTGSAAEQYDVFYRAHIQSYGWLGWAKNGQNAGSEGLAKRLKLLRS